DTVWHRVKLQSWNANGALQRGGTSAKTTGSTPPPSSRTGPQKRVSWRSPQQRGSWRKSTTKRASLRRPLGTHTGTHTVSGNRATRRVALTVRDVTPLRP